MAGFVPVVSGGPRLGLHFSGGTPRPQSLSGEDAALTLPAPTIRTPPATRPPNARAVSTSPIRTRRLVESAQSRFMSATASYTRPPPQFAWRRYLQWD